MDTLLDIPEFALVVLIGATGSGKSTFAKRWFKPTETISSDYARALVSDEENDQSVSADAFDLVRAIAEKRLKNRKLAVIDATNVRAPERKQWVELARRWHALPVAIVLDPGLDVCVQRNKGRPDRNFGPGVPQRMISEIRKGLRGLQREGFRQVWKLSSVEEVEAARIERRPLWTDKREDIGPFDVIGDVHGCADELERLTAQLGYELSWEGDGDRVARLTAPRRNPDQPLFVSEPLIQTGRVMIKDEDLCVHCGLCAERCPTDAWDMQKSWIKIPLAEDEARCQSAKALRRA